MFRTRHALVAVLTALALFGAACSGGGDSLATASDSLSAEIGADGNDTASDGMADDAASEGMADDDPPSELALADDGSDNVMVAGTDAVTEASEECVTDALADDPQLETQWLAILEYGGASVMNIGDQQDAIDPILGCVTFGQVVAAVVADESGTALSADSVGCIDRGLAGNEDLLVSVLSGTDDGPAESQLAGIIASCVSDDELASLMAAN